MSVATNFPTEPGYYWAKWRIATDETLEGDEVTPSDLWEIVQVNDNNGEPGTLEELSVAVAGVRESQWRDGFFWGERVADLNPVRPQPVTSLNSDDVDAIIEREYQRVEGLYSARAAVQNIKDAVFRLRARQAQPSQALQDIASERQRQQEAEGWTQDKEDQLEHGDLAWVGQTYAKGGRCAVWGWAWPERQEFTSRRSELVAAAAWIAAEIERLDRAEVAKSSAS